MSTVTENVIRRPEPVLDQAKVVQKVTGGLTAVLTLAALAGLVTAEQIDGLVVVLVGVVGAVVTAVNFIVPIVRARIARGKVTPLASPQTASGRPLVVANATPAPEPAQGLVDWDDDDEDPEENMGTRTV